MSHGARMNVKLVLDTCAMRDRDFIQWLTQRKSGEVCLPSVAYMELYRQTIAGKRSTVDLSELLKKCNIKILPFEKREAEIAAEFMSRSAKVCPACNKLDWTDTMIYACVGNPPTVFVTDNVSDFPTEFGDYIMRPSDVIRKMD